MNDHELARKLARETGTLLIGLRNHAASLSGGEDETHSVLAEEVLGSEGDRVAHDYLMEQFSIHRPTDVVLSEEGDLEVARLDAKRVWIIDPLDGTAQYSTGGEDFAVHIALWEASSPNPSQISAASLAVPARNNACTSTHITHAWQRCEQGGMSTAPAAEAGSPALCVAGHRPWHQHGAAGGAEGPVQPAR